MLVMTIVLVFNDRDMINQCLLYRYVIRAIGDHKGMTAHKDDPDGHDYVFAKRAQGRVMFRVNYLFWQQKDVFSGASRYR